MATFAPSRARARRLLPYLRYYLAHTTGFTALATGLALAITGEGHEAVLAFLTAGAAFGLPLRPGRVDRPCR